MCARNITIQNIDDFHHYLIREEKSAVTVEKYLRDVRAFFDHVNGKCVDKESVIDYKQFLIGKKYAVRSINSMLASVNSFLAFMGWADCKVKNIRQQRKVYCLVLCQDLVQIKMRSSAC